MWCKLGTSWKHPGVLPAGFVQALPGLLLCSIVFSSQWVFGCVWHCRDSVTELTLLPWLWNWCPMKCSEQFAFQTSDTITWGDHGAKLEVAISATGASNRSHDGTKILPKWAKIALCNTVLLVLARHYFNLGPEVSGWWSSSLHSNADTKPFHLFILAKKLIFMGSKWHGSLN